MSAAPVPPTLSAVALSPVYPPHTARGPSPDWRAVAAGPGILEESEEVEDQEMVSCLSFRVAYNTLYRLTPIWCMFHVATYTPSSLSGRHPSSSDPPSLLQSTAGGSLRGSGEGSEGGEDGDGDSCKGGEDGDSCEGGEERGTD